MPLTVDDEWVEALGDVIAWQPPTMRTIILAPHPDDETLGTGGLIATLRGCGTEVVVVAATDGENAYSESGVLGPIRSQEQEDALRTLGVGREQIVRLRLPDRNIASQEAALTDSLLSIISPGCHLVAPWIGDFHPDHEACGRVAQEVAKQTNALLSYYFFWTWHRGLPETVSGLPLKRLLLDERTVGLKNEAIRKHRSQLEHPEEPILSEDLLKPTLWPFEVFADA